MIKEEKIRAQLADLLVKEPQNYSKILELSNLLASFDEENARFTVDAGVIDKLGRELVGRKETAVSELIKNAYDADATQVDLYFENSEEEGGTLTIIDNGVGMSKDELINGFMRISSTEKIHNPSSSLFNRTRAGKKGIGRFAVQRLGESLTITTQKQNSRKSYRIDIDWRKYQSDLNLFSISNKIEEVKSTNAGTHLVISGLRDKWGTKEIERVYRYVIGLMQPFPLSETITISEKSRANKYKDPGFKTALYKIDQDGVKLIANEDTEIFKYALATFDASVDSKGVGRYSVTSPKLKINQKNKLLGPTREEPEKAYHFIKNVNLKAYFFLQTDDTVPPQQKSRIRDLAQHSGGIRLYRNGFRVLPYGEPFDDWLRLDESEKRRSILPRHGNSNFFGFVEIYDRTGEMFEETSSREGLLENDAFDELRDFGYRAITAGVIVVANKRDIKITTSQKGWQKRFEKATDRLEFVKDEIKKVAVESQLDAESSKKGNLSKGEIVQKLENRSSVIKAIEDSLGSLIDEQRKEDELQIQETNVLRVLASLGLTIGIFAHEVRQYLGSIESSLILLKRRFTADKNYQQRIERLSSNIRQLRTYTSFFDKTVSENISRELHSQDLSVIVEQFKDTIALDKSAKRISFSSEYQGLDFSTVPMHFSEWSTILFNLYTNSLKAIKRAKSDGKIRVVITEEKDEILLEFFDNGDGIPEKNWEKVFEPFFTTSTPSGHFAQEQDEILGTGLGLKIVRDTVSAYGGSVEVISPIRGYKTGFRLIIPKDKS